MKVSIRLQDLLQQNDQAITATSILIAQGIAQLDASDIDAIAPEQLALLCAHLPIDPNNLHTLFDETTLSDSFRRQIDRYLHPIPDSVRLTLTEAPSPTPDSPTTLDVFHLRNEVIGDYRRYINSFLKIRDR